VVEGTAFGRYQLLHLLGRGGMGEVWRAHDTDTDRIVAIKLLPAHFSENEDFKRRFRREAHAAARLNSPHVIPIHNYGEIDDRLYVDMRLIEGQDLQTVLADGPLDPPRAVRIVEQVALALHAAHKVGLVHRDVKPSNILLDENDFAYLIDFGIARAADETRLTKSGNTIGSFHYIAPERLDTGTEEDARADIYSLACVLYECLTGRPPFAEDSMARLVAAHLNTPPPQPSTTQPTVPPQLDHVISTGMAKDPNRRYATTVELASAAHDAVTTPVPPPEATPLPEPPTQQAPAPVTPPAMAPRPPPPQVQHPPTPVAQPRSGFTSAPTWQRPPQDVPTQRHQPPARPPGKPPSATRPWWRRMRFLIPAVVLVPCREGAVAANLR
jgi:serine/threonine-protein kinase